MYLWLDIITTHKRIYDVDVIFTYHKNVNLELWPFLDNIDILNIAFVIIQNIAFLENNKTKICYEMLLYLKWRFINEKLVRNYITEN